VTRWWYELQRFDFDKEHISGPENYLADMMSRIPRKNPFDNQQELLACLNCGPCMAHTHIQSDKQGVDYLYTITSELVPDAYKHAFDRVHSAEHGHWGLEKTLQYMKELRNYDGNPAINSREHRWLRKHVTKLIKMCPMCQKLSYIRPHIEGQHFTVAAYAPMDTISIDHLTGLPWVEVLGYEALLVIIDNFSRFIELYPVQSANARETAQRLLEFFGRYGTPRRILSDRGPEFVNEVIKHLFETMKLEHTKTLAYSKQENSIVERSNKEVLRHLRAIVTDRMVIQEWWMYLPLVQRAMNASKHERLGVSPAEIVFGSATRLQKGFLIPLDNNVHFDSESLSMKVKKFRGGKTVYEPSEPGHTEGWTVQQHMRQLKFMQRRIIALASQSQQEIDKEHMDESMEKHLHLSPGATNDVKASLEPATRQLTVFPLYSYVLTLYRNTAMGNKPETKLHPFWRGPLQVIHRDGNTYTLHNMVTNRNELHHVKNLKPFVYDLNQPDIPRYRIIRW